MASPLNEVDRGIVDLALEHMGLDLDVWQRNILDIALGTIVGAHRYEAASDTREAAGLPR